MVGAYFHLETIVRLRFTYYLKNWGCTNEAHQVNQVSQIERKRFIALRTTATMPFGKCSRAIAAA